MNIYEGYIRVEKRSYCREHEENISNEALQKKIFPHEHQKTVEMIKINRWSQTSLALLSQFFSYTRAPSLSTISKNHRIIDHHGLEATLKLILFQSLLWPGPPSTRPGCSKPHPTCPISSRDGASRMSLRNFKIYI